MPKRQTRPFRVTYNRHGRETMNPEREQAASAASSDLDQALTRLAWLVIGREQVARSLGKRTRWPRGWRSQIETALDAFERLNDAHGGTRS